MQYWTIVSASSGEVLAPCFITGSEDQHPKDAGWTWDAAKQRAVKIGARPGPNDRFNGSAWIEDAAMVQVQLLADVKAEAERRKMLLLTPGGAKKTEYADKYREVTAWDTLGGTAAAILLAFNALPAGSRGVRFAYALADAAAFGDTPADAIGRFKAGIAKASSIATLSATEAKGCAAIKAASTAAAKRAAAAAIVWPA